MSADLADASVGGKDDNGCQAALQGSIEVGEALDVQHVHLIYEQHAWNQLSHSLINISVHHLQHSAAFLTTTQMRPYLHGTSGSHSNLLGQYTSSVPAAQCHIIDSDTDKVINLWRLRLCTAQQAEALRPPQRHTDSRPAAQYRIIDNNTDRVIDVLATSSMHSTTGTTPSMMHCITACSTVPHC